MNRNDGLYISQIVFRPEYELLSNNDRVIYAMICRHALNGDYGKGPELRISQSQLIDEALVSRRTVQRSLERLTKTGLLEVKSGKKRKYYKVHIFK